MLETNENLPQLYRFCFLMTGEQTKAKQAFQSTLRAAAALAAKGEPVQDRLWFFRDARWQSLIASESGLQAEPGFVEDAELTPESPAQIAQLLPEQLAVWISAAPEPQRSALAVYYLDEFSLADMLSMLELKAKDFSEMVERGRHEFQAWLNATTPPPFEG